MFGADARIVAERYDRRAIVDAAWRGSMPAREKVAARIASRARSDAGGHRKSGAYAGAFHVTTGPRAEVRVVGTGQAIREKEYGTSRERGLGVLTRAAQAEGKYRGWHIR